MKTLNLYFLVILLTATFSLHAQPDSSWNVALTGKGKTFEQKNDTWSFSTRGFYLYRNCVYDMVLDNGTYLSGRLVDVKQDTLCFTSAFNQNQALKYKRPFDTLVLHYRQLKTLRLIADRAMGIYSKYSLDGFDFRFFKDTAAYVFSSEWLKLYVNDSSLYEVVPHLTAQGMGELYEQDGRTYFFYGPGMFKPDKSKMDTTYDQKKVFLFTPTRSEKVDGIAFGLYTENNKNDAYNEKDSLTVNGMAIEVNPFMVFALMYGATGAPYKDSLDFCLENIKNHYGLVVNGFNLSAIGTHSDAQINGFNLGGANTVIYEMKGFSVSGINHFSYFLHGVSIAGLCNRSSITRGVQIGLYNRSTDLRGFQFGLWNKNGKRSLPFINWQFRAASKKE